VICHVHFWSGQEAEDRVQISLSSLLFFIHFLMLSFPEISHGHGFANSAQGPKATAMGGAFTAIADDPTACFYNPAGIAYLDGTQVLAGSTVFTNWDAEFVSAGNSQIPGVTRGDEFKLKGETSALPFVHATHSLAEGLGFGFSAYSMWGQKNLWPDGWEGRFAPGGKEAKIGSYRVQAVGAYAPSEKFAVSAGLYHEWLDLSMRQSVWSQLLVTEFDYSIEGCSDGTGWLAGILVRPNEYISLGATYRSGVRHSLDSLDVGISPEISAFGIESTGGSMNFSTPAMLNVGTALAWEKWTLAFDVQWTQWSAQDVLDISFERPVFGNTGSRLQKKWNDTVTYGVGIEYACSEAVKLRAGYIYDESPVPSSTLDPMVFSGDSQLFCLGLGFEKGGFKADASYSHLISEGRTFDNAAGDFPNPGGQRIVGEFEDSSCDIFVLSLSYAF
jgi:long-chain fatty acid transport protein